VNAEINRFSESRVFEIESYSICECADELSDNSALYLIPEAPTNRDNPIADRVS